MDDELILNNQDITPNDNQNVNQNTTPNVNQDANETNKVNNEVDAGTNNGANVERKNEDTATKTNSEIVGREAFLQQIKVKDVKNLTPDEMKTLDEKPLTEREAFRLVEDDPKKIEQYDLFSTLKEKALNGELSTDQLKFLCDTAFGKDSKESELVYDKMIKAGRVKQEEKKKEPYKIDHPIDYDRGERHL